MIPVLSFSTWKLAKLVCISMVIFSFLSCTEQQPKERPNILLILSDDAGYNDFGFQGSKEMLTPNIDKLARNGIVFENAYVTASVCSPSRAGLLTGGYQQRFGHEANLEKGFGMDPNEVTLAEALKKLNYRTGIFGKWHLGSEEHLHPNKCGFDEFYGMRSGGRSYFPNEKQDKAGSGTAVMHNDKYVKFDGYYTDILGEKAIEFIEETTDQPFFCYLSFTAVHTPMHAKEEHLEKFKDSPRPILKSMTWAMDEAIGRVMERLEKNNLLDNTLIIFTNDNGGSAFNTSNNEPFKGWKGNKYEGGLHVPFILHWNDQLEGGQKFDGITSTLDIFATAFTAAGGTEHGGKKLDGVNLLPFIKTKSSENPHDILFWRKEEESAVRWKEWKLIRLKDYGYVLYNLHKNLGETENMIEKQPDIFNKMKSELEKWESELLPPIWHEPQEWRDVTYDIHKFLMQNKPVTKKNPAN